MKIMESLGIRELIASYNPYYEDSALSSNEQRSLYSKHVELLRSSSKNADLVEFKRAVVDGTYYEYFSEALLQRGLIPDDMLAISDEILRKKEIRSFAKKATFRALFDKVESSRYSPYVRAFKECFPTVYKVFLLVKSGKRFKVNKRGEQITESTYNTLACVLQRFESFIVLHKTCIEIHERNPEIPIFTIHDSVVTVQSHADLVIQVFRKHLIELIGVVPALHTEEW